MRERVVKVAGEIVLFAFPGMTHMLVGKDSFVVNMMMGGDMCGREGWGCVRVEEIER